jgi:hypothetical protein
MNCLKYVDVAALLIQLLATILMYLNSPDNTAKGFHMFGEDDEKFRRIDNKRNKRLRFGFLLLLIGIAISLISTIIK